MLQGFKNFLLRGNVIELAVAVVIGTAFTNLVKSFTDSFVNPLIAWVLGGGEAGGTVALDNENRLLFGGFLNGVITFLVTAAVVYFVFVLPIQKLTDRRKKGQPAPAPPAPAEDIVILREIRDLLAADNPKRL